MGGVRNRWINLIHEIMVENKRGFGVDELRHRLFDKMRDPPSARQITSNLKIDKRFQSLGKRTAGSLLRAKSHEVTVFGLVNKNYDDIHPYRQR
jgi:hypothetical protein